MAVSGLEQRRVPLVVSSAVWSPWGPGMVGPYAMDGSEEHGNDHGDCKPTQQVRPRSLSWGSYSTHAQCSTRGFASESDPQGEVDTTLSALSHHVVAGRGKSGWQHRETCSRQGVAPQVEPPPTSRAGSHGLRESGSLTLGGKQPVSKTKQSAKKSDAGPRTTSSVGVAEQPEAVENEGKTVITTLAIRNLPYGLAQQDLLQAMDESGFAGLYDFVYLPHKFKEHRNLGFAFVNFVSEDVARRFSAEWHHTRRFTMGSMRKRLDISPAVVQGRQNQLSATSRKMGRVKNSSYRPLVLDGFAGTIANGETAGNNVSDSTSVNMGASSMDDRGKADEHVNDESDAASASTRESRTVIGESAGNHVNDKSDAASESTRDESSDNGEKAGNHAKHVSDTALVSMRGSSTDKRERRRNRIKYVSGTSSVSTREPSIDNREKAGNHVKDASDTAFVSSRATSKIDCDWEWRCLQDVLRGRGWVETSFVFKQMSELGADDSAIGRAIWCALRNGQVLRLVHPDMLHTVPRPLVCLAAECMRAR